MMGKQKEKPIKVYVRIRPLNTKEIQKEEESAVEIYPGDVDRVRLIDHKSSYDTSYRFDRVFDAADSNNTVFHYTTRDNLIKLLNGTNCSLIAYGETGSGKTYTLMENGGVTDYTISYLFKLMEADQMHSYRVSCSFVQVYVEKLYDILSANTKNELLVREHPSKGVYVQGLSEHIVSKERHVFDLFAKGKTELIRGHTEMHHLSSRSHSIFQITIQRTLAGGKESSSEEEYCSTVNRFNKVPQGLNVLPRGMVVCGKLDICDLAGSERLGKTLLGSVNHNEARYINSSLLHLGNVICALAEKRQRHVPFRNSTLTRLLQECLGSECLTSFIICVSPSSKEIHETRCSLNFGSRARAITNRFRYLRRAINHELLTKNLSTKIRLLEKQLFDKSSAHTPLVCSDSHAQTDEEVSEEVGIANLYIGMVKQTLQLSDVLDKCNHAFYNNSKCQNEDEHEVCDKASRKGSKKCTGLKLIISSVTKRISDIVVKLQVQLQTESYFNSMHDTKYTKNKFETAASNGYMENNLEESGWTLSEVCSEIRNNIEAIVESMNNAPKVIQFEGPVETHAWYIHLNQLLNDFDEKELESFNFKSFNFPCYLVYLFQLVQIVRLSIEYSIRKPKSEKVRPIICSTSLEDGAISSSTPSTTLDLYNFTPHASPTKYYKKLKASWTPKLNKHFEGTDRATGDKKHFRKRRRRKSENNIRKCFSVLPFSYPLVDVEDSSTFYRNQVRNAEAGNETMASVYANVVSRYNELHQKYFEAVEENDDLFLKLDHLEQELEQEHEDSIQLPSFEEDRDMYYATRDEKGDELIQIEEECSRYRMKVDKSEETVRQLSEEIMGFETLINAQDNIMVKLESEKNGLIKQRDDNIAKNKGMQQMRKNIKSFQQFFESRISISEQILHFSEVVDEFKVKQNKAKFKVITELEQEVFLLLEGNVQYEKTLEDIRKKMINYFRHINEMEYKITDHVIPSNDDAKETLEEEDDPKLMILPISPTECDFKLSEQEICNEQVMQNIIVGDLHKSPEKNSAKDLKTCQLIKELLRGKLKLISKIEKMERALKYVEDKIVRDKGKIDVFVKELGQLDQQLDGVAPNPKQHNEYHRDVDCTESSIFSEGEMELVEVSEMSYDSLNIFMQYFSNGEGGTEISEKEHKSNKNVQLLLDDELEEMRSEVNYYKRKCSEMKSQSNELNDCLQEDLESTNKSLLCKIDYLKHTNILIEKEIKRAKKQSFIQRNELKILKDKNVKIAEQVNASKFQKKQIEAKIEITRLQLEKHLSKYKTKNIYLEKCVKDLVEEEEEEDERNELRDESSFNDSGVPAEDLSDS